MEASSFSETSAPLRLSASPPNYTCSHNGKTVISKPTSVRKPNLTNFKKFTNKR
jgi:hypothetical protein